MTVRTPEGPPKLGEALSRPEERSPHVEQVADVEQIERGPDETLVDVTTTSLASALAAAAAGSIAGGLFAGGLPRLIGSLGAVLGAVLVWLSYRSKRVTLIQFAIVPIAVAAGAVAALSAGGGNLATLVMDALRGGGIARPPVAFEPGWRFLLTVLVIVLGGAGAALACGLNKPRIGVLLPTPVLFGALLAQSGETNVVPIVVGFALLIAAFAVSFGVDLAREGATSGGFELRRLGKGAAAMLLLVGLLTGVSQAGFLFPEPREHDVIPPRRPEPAPPQPDRELFTVRADRAVPWRLGVLDVYDGRAWLTPPIDPGRTIPVRGPVPHRPGVVRTAAPSRLEAAFQISDIQGRVLPTVAGASAVEAALPIDYDPRTQTLRVPVEQTVRGLRYTVSAPLPAKGKDLAKAPKAPVDLAEFLTVPPPPAEVAEVLEEAPKRDLFSRLQFVRERFYEKVVAKGAGQPVDVPPARVAALLDGDPGSPFEITASEALLARWVGVPARIGYGYFGGDEVDGEDETLSIRPKHGATWLEAYFHGHGWVPIVGTPPRAQSSLDSADKNRSVTVRPSENLTITVLVPMRVQSIQLLYVLVQYWLARVLPALLGIGLLVWLYPGALKLLRRRRRERWAAPRGLDARIRVAYAGFRDAAHDAGVGLPADTPLEFLSRVEEDREHRELAWLVTRCLWGDLARDIREEDAEIAREMARSLTGRLRSARTVSHRLSAFASRRSLREPFADQIPNLWWPQPSLRSRARPALTRPFKRLRRAAPATAALLIMILFTGCVQDVTLAASPAENLPAVIVPDRLGDFGFKREPVSERAFSEAGPEALVGSGRVFSITRDDDVVGALQVAAFKKAVSARKREVRAGVLQALGGGAFKLERLGRDTVYTQRLPEQRRLLWFPPSSDYYELLITRADVEDALTLFASVLAHQRGDTADVVVEQVDPRRGSAG